MGSKLKEFGKRLLVRYSLNECLEGGSLEARLCPTLAKSLLSTFEISLGSVERLPSGFLIVIEIWFTFFLEEDIKLLIPSFYLNELTMIIYYDTICTHPIDHRGISCFSQFLFFSLKNSCFCLCSNLIMMT